MDAGSGQQKSEEPALYFPMAFAANGGSFSTVSTRRSGFGRSAGSEVYGAQRRAMTLAPFDELLNTIGSQPLGSTAHADAPVTGDVHSMLEEKGVSNSATCHVAQSAGPACALVVW